MSRESRASLDPPPVSPADAAALLRGRRSVSRFAPGLPSAKLIEAAVDAARWAPNHHLTEPWRFYRLGPEAVAAVIALNTELVAAARDPQVAAAKQRRWSEVPGWLVLTCRQCNDDPLRAREDYAACACAAQNFMLHLWSNGVASKWTTGAVTREARFYRLLELDPEMEEVVALFWYGWPAHEPRMRRKPVEEILFVRD